MTSISNLAAKVDYELDQLRPAERETIDANRETIRRLGSAAHLQDYLSLGPGLLVHRRAAMRVSNSNAPTGRRYNDAIEEMLRRIGVDTDDKKLMREITSILFIFSDPNHQQVLNEALAQMTPAQVMRINLPTTARAIIARVYKEREGIAATETNRPPALAVMKQSLVERDHRIADLEERLAAAQADAEEGSLFGPTDSARRVADVLGRMNFSDDKINEICKLAKQIRRERARATP